MNVYNRDMSEENKEWARNLTKTEDGIFRTINGSADELIGIGRTIKAGFNCSRVDIPNGRYDAIVDVGGGKMLRIQIKGVGVNKNGKLGSVSFTYEFGCSDFCNKVGHPR